MDEIKKKRMRSKKKTNDTCGIKSRMGWNEMRKKSATIYDLVYSKKAWAKSSFIPSLSTE
jgi:hypothetical protein